MHTYMGIGRDAHTIARFADCLHTHFSSVYDAFSHQHTFSRSFFLSFSRVQCACMALACFWVSFSCYFIWFFFIIQLFGAFGLFLSWLVLCTSSALTPFTHSTIFTYAAIIVRHIHAIKIHFTFDVEYLCMCLMCACDGV